MENQCVGCGHCCLLGHCDIYKRLFSDSKQRCPMLVWVNSEGRYRCFLLREIFPGGDKYHKEGELGTGCPFPDNPYRNNVRRFD